MATTEEQLAEIRAYLAWLPSYMRGKDAERLEWLLELADKQAEQLKRTYCTYCGTEFLLDDDAGTRVTEHIYACQEHPMWALQERVDDLQIQVANLAVSEAAFSILVERLKERVRELEAERGD